MTSLPALTVYTFSPCANWAPVATRSAACLVVRRRCTVAPVRTLRFGRPSAGKRYACGTSACEDPKHVLERERTSNRTEADVLRVPVRGSTVDAHLNVPACCIAASHDKDEREAILVPFVKRTAPPSCWSGTGAVSDKRSDCADEELTASSMVLTPKVFSACSQSDICFCFLVNPEIKSPFGSATPHRRLSG